MHRFLGILAGLFIAIHVGSIALDTVVPFSLTQLVVPFTASYRPLATGLGVVALELLVAVGIANRLRSRLPYRVWRRVHYSTFAVWLATGHGILAGTDRDQAWLHWLYGLAVALVVGAAALRLAARRRHGGLSWRSGSPPGHSRRFWVSPPCRSSPRAPPRVRRSGDRDPGAERRPLRHDRERRHGHRLDQGTAAASAFRIDLLTNQDERVSDSALQVRFPGGTTCEGTLTALDQSGFSGTCELPGGVTRTVRATWTVSDGTVSGTISTSGGSASTSA